MSRHWDWENSQQDLLQGQELLVWNYSISTQFPTDNKHDLRLYLTSKIVPIHSDIGNMHLLLRATHDNSVISFQPTVTDTVF